MKRMERELHSAIYCCLLSLGQFTSAFQHIFFFRFLFASSRPDNSKERRKNYFYERKQSETKKHFLTLDL